MPGLRNTVRITGARIGVDEARIPLDGVTAPRWTEQALCTEVDAELWFPPIGASARQARRICQECPVRFECLEEAIANDEAYGIFGGLNVTERRRLKKAVAESERLGGAA